jgi:hypothetical protein
LNLTCDILVSKLLFTFNLYRCNLGVDSRLNAELAGMLARVAEREANGVGAVQVECS